LNYFVVAETPEQAEELAYKEHATTAFSKVRILQSEIASVNLDESRCLVYSVDNRARKEVIEPVADSPETLKNEPAQVV
jgi:hypothetical protein